MITLEHTSEAPLEVTVANAPAVKLGLDMDRYNVPIAVTGTVLVMLGIAGVLLMKRRRQD